MAGGDGREYRRDDSGHWTGLERYDSVSYTEFELYLNKRKATEGCKQKKSIIKCAC